jgi:hypothetical protein
MKIKKLIKIVLLLAFLLIILLPLFDSALMIFFKIDLEPKVTLSENRDLAQMPKIELTANSTLNFPKEFEAYFNDNFGFRKMLIKEYNALKVRYLLSSSQENIIVGKEGWFYWAGYNNYLNKYQAPFTEDKLDLFQKNIAERKAWFDGQGIKYFVVIIPDKHSIYPEYLPDNIKQLISLNNQSRYDQILERMNQANLSDVMIDVRKPILDEKEKNPDKPYYSQLDSHWNDLAAFVAYQTILDKINDSEIKPLSISDFDMAETNGNNDMLTLIGLDLKKKDYTLIPKKARLANITEINETDITGINNRFKEINLSGMKSIQRYPVIISECSSCPNKTAIVIRDSQFILIPFFSEHFSRVIYLNRQGRSLESAYMGIIKSEHPDIVIDEEAERDQEYLFNLNLLTIQS